MNLVQGAGNSLIKWGSQVQWAGRQLTYNFTLPLAIAGVAAGKWALDIESSFVRVRKVYGDFSLSSDVMNSELDALQRNFEALSNHFGVHQKEVNEIAGDWAAAGASGKALANGVRMTLEAMILGEMEAAEATEALIAVQAQYSFSTEQMRDAIASLNMVENETGATMQDLIVSMARSAGTARDAGVDIEHLAAMTAALVPASGSAATAGNGLRTIISRLLAPTKQAAELLGMMGYSMEDLSWGSLTADQRLETLAGEFVKLDKAQRAYITTQVASRWQINRFSVLMRDIASEHGYYQKALDATADKERNALQVRQELNAVLSSNPARLKQMWTLLQNGMADVIQPLIPWVVYLASEIAKLVNNFNNLSPTLQKAIIFGVAFLALVGPIGRYIGAAAVFVGTLTKAFGWLTRSLFTVTAVTKVMSDGTVKATKAFGGLLPFILRLIRAPFNVLFTAIGAVVGMFARLPQVGAAVLAWARTFGTAVTTALTGPIGIAIVAAIALIAIFWKDIQSFFTQFVDNMRGQAGGIQKAFSPIVEFFHKAVESVIRAFNALPQAIQRPLRAVVDMVKRVAMAVYNWFSYLNPFQRHSPSLVESVTWGMAIVRKQYESIDGVRGIFKRAAGDLVAYKKMLASMNFDEWAGERENVAEVMPQGLPLFDKLVKELKVLNQLLIAQGNAVKKQEKVVERWSKKLEKANEALDKQRKVLDSIQAEMDELQAVYDGHQDALDRYASAGIIGMQAMSDKIFDNEMAQKRLRLEILRMEEAGFSVEDVQSKMAALQGEIEGLFGLMKDLERNGAGSDVTGPIATTRATPSVTTRSMSCRSSWRSWSVRARFSTSRTVSNSTRSSVRLISWSTALTSFHSTPSSTGSTASARQWPISSLSLSASASATKSRRQLSMSSSVSATRSKSATTRKPRSSANSATSMS
jgi:TP901 family phage tail tape measure protein